jgi:prenyltransferase beta subunit
MYVTAARQRNYNISEYPDKLRGHPMGATLNLRDIIGAAITYVMARRKETGGFGATPRLPATIQDTYHALNILKLTRHYVVPETDGYDSTGDKNLHDYLATCCQRLQVDARTRFQLLWGSRLIGRTIEHRLVRETVAAQMRTYKVPEEWYYHVRILREILHEDTPDRTDITAPAEVTARNFRTVREAWMQLYLADFIGCQLPVAENELTGWIQNSQNSDGGFGFFPRTTSFVENCHASLRALAFMKAGPTNPSRAFEFLAGCQTVSGGFGRASRAAPFLDTTWHGLAALQILSQQMNKK